MRNKDFLFDQENLLIGIAKANCAFNHSKTDDSPIVHYNSTKREYPRKTDFISKNNDVIVVVFFFLIVVVIVVIGILIKVLRKKNNEAGETKRKY